MNQNINWDDFSQVVSQHLGMEPNEVKADTHLYNELGIDSLGIVSLGLVLQKHFQVQIPIAAVAGISTLGGIQALLEQSQ